MLQVRHEQAAVHLTDGYYRVASVPLAVFTSIGPSAMNTVTGVASCYVDFTPVLVLTGNNHTHMAGQGVLQEIERQHDTNGLAVFESITKRVWRPSNVERLPRILQRGFTEMLTRRRGPVIIDLAMDVQCDSTDVGVGLPAPHAYRPTRITREDPGIWHASGGSAPSPALTLKAGGLAPVTLAPTHSF